jgi:RNA polymerase sigma-70 factor (ECF subfamily)
MNDRDAVSLCQDGDREAFRHLVERYSGVLHGTAYLMTHDRALTEELVQEALLSAWRGIGGFHDSEPVKPWLVRILVNRVISHQRRRSLPTVPIPDVPEPAAPERVAEEAEARDSVRRGMAALDDQQRQALTLRYYAEVTIPEIGQALGWPEGTVKSRIHRGLETMRAVIGE